MPIWENSPEEVEDLLRLAIESRKRVKDQLARIDATYPEVDFYYLVSGCEKRRVTTVEEEEYPQFYHLKPMLDPKEHEQRESTDDDRTADETYEEAMMVDRTPRVFPFRAPAVWQACGTPVLPLKGGQHEQATQ